jgi:ATP-binding cassette subfamily F protein 3
MAGTPEAKVRARIGQFGFSQDKADVRASDLSGGERSRLLLALMSHDAPHIMIFDEPTNHLDIDSREALVRALNTTTAAIVLISHDRHLLETCADRLWLVADGTVRPFDGDLEDYRALALADRGGPGPTAGTARERRESKRDARKAAALARQETASLRKAAAGAEAELARLTKDRAALEAALADPDLYAGEPARVGELTKQRAKLDRAIGAAEEAWLAAQEALERSG